MSNTPTLPDIFEDIFADFCGICDEGFAFIKRQHEYDQQINQLHHDTL